MSGKQYKCAECGEWSESNVGTMLSMCSEACASKATARFRANFDPRAAEFNGSALQAAARLPSGGREALGHLARLLVPPSLADSAEGFLARMKAEAEKLKGE